CTRDWSSVVCSSDLDISNISDTFAVAAMVSFKNARPDRSNYRRFRMKTVVGQDDFACMAETVRRRYTRLKTETESGPGGKWSNRSEERRVGKQCTCV